MGDYLTAINQDETEIAAFVDLLVGEGVMSYLEIGSKFGGSLWRVANALPAGSRIVAVDLPDSAGGHSASRASLTACIEALRTKGYDAQLIWGDSTDPTLVEQVRALGPFDAMLIDANHTLPYVTQDFANYGPMGRMVAFHDIAWKRKGDWTEGKRIDVPQFWASVKTAAARWQEFRFCPTGKNNGIGVLWRD